MERQNDQGRNLTHGELYVLGVDGVEFLKGMIHSPPVFLQVSKQGMFWGIENRRKSMVAISQNFAL